jgi:predicted transcriptional regulator
LIDRELPRLQTRLDELNKQSQGGAPLTAAQKQEFISLTNQRKLLADRRRLLLERVGDEYVTAPPRLATKP